MARPYTAITLTIMSRGNDNLTHNELPWAVEIRTHGGSFIYHELFSDLNEAYDFASNFLAPESR